MNRNNIIKVLATSGRLPEKFSILPPGLLSMGLIELYTAVTDQERCKIYSSNPFLDEKFLRELGSLRNQNYVFAAAGKGGLTAIFLTKFGKKFAEEFKPPAAQD